MVASGRCLGVGGWFCPCRLCICLYFGFSAGRVGECRNSTFWLLGGVLGLL